VVAILMAAILMEAILTVEGASLDRCATQS
jgi:hypothetical protein